MIASQGKNRMSKKGNIQKPTLERPSTSTSHENSRQRNQDDRLIQRIVRQVEFELSRSRSRSPRSRRRDQELSNSLASTSTREQRSAAPREEELCIIKYDPSRREMKVEDWIRHVDELALERSWDDRTVMKLIATRLIVPPNKYHAWYSAHPQETYTWSELKEILLGNYSKNVSVSKLIKEAVNYEAELDQSLGNYCRKKLHKLRKVNMAEELIVEMVIDGIPNLDVTTKNRLQQFKDPNKLYTFMCNLDNV